MASIEPHDPQAVADSAIGVQKHPSGTHPVHSEEIINKGSIHLKTLCEKCTRYYAAMATINAIDI